MDSTNLSAADVAAVTGGSRGGMGFGDNGAWWIIILFLFAFMGWGNNNNGGSGGVNYIPYAAGMTTGVQAGFDQAAVMSGLGDIGSAVTSGFANTSTQLCNGFAGVNATINGGFANAETAANARQMANMNQIFGLQSAMQNCCCENRAATADLKYTIASEACNDRATVTNALQQVTTQNAANTQRILDQMCADKIEQKNDIIAQLRSELLYARGQASQDVQTATIAAGQRTLANEVEQYIAPKAVPAYIVQNPNCCGNNYGCGCVA